MPNRATRIVVTSALLCLPLTQSVFAEECVRERRPPVQVIGALCGILLDPSKAMLSGADVYLIEVTPAAEDGSVPRRARTLHTVRTDSRGRFTFVGVPKGEYLMTTPGFQTSFETVVVNDAAARACKHRLGVELSVTGACSGSLSSGTGVLLRVDAATPARVVVDGIEDSMGYYDAETRLLELSPGAHRIEIQADGYVPYRIDVTVREFQAVRRVAKLRRLKP